MTTWPDLVAAALVGTDRRPLPDAADPAAAVLERAAAWSVYRRAGRLPVRGLAAAEPAPAEDHRVVGPAAAARLAGLLEAMWMGAISSALVAEWLGVAAQRRLRLPPELLPDLLDAARRDPALRSLILAAGGHRATWLAGQSPEWTYLTSTMDLRSTTDGSAHRDPQTWHEGTRGQRAAYLTALRRDDPEAARALLADGWASLPPDERVQLLTVLATGLGPADEDLLESALDDRRKEVRAAAADLLAALPGSRYNGRMAARVRASLRVGPDGVLLVEPPATCDQDMRRDGIAVRPPAGIGERAWWLEQVLARAPLPSVSPAEFLSLSIADDWSSTVHHGLAQAAARGGEPAWAAALLDILEPRIRPGSRHRHLVEDLYPALAPDELVRRSVAAFAGLPDAQAGEVLGRLLPHIPAPWPDELSAAALRGIDAAARGRGPWRDRDGVGRLAAMRMSADVAPAATALAGRLRAEHPDNSAVHALDRMAETLSLRHHMIQEIA